MGCVTSAAWLVLMAALTGVLIEWPMGLAKIVALAVIVALLGLVVHVSDAGKGEYEGYMRDQYYDGNG